MIRVFVKYPRGYHYAGEVESCEIEQVVTFVEKIQIKKIKNGNAYGIVFKQARRNK